MNILARLRNSRSGRVAAIMIAVLAFSALCASAPFIEIPNLAWYRMLLEHGPRLPAQQSIVGITIDEPSCAALGRWPWKRSVHARLIDRLTSYGAKVIAFDIYFTAPTEAAEDSALAGALARSGRVVLAIGRHKGQELARPLFLDVLGYNVGHAFLRKARDNVVYGVKLIEESRSPEFPEFSFIPSLGLRTFQKFAGLDEAMPEMGSAAITYPGLTIPLDVNEEMAIRFLGPPGSFPCVSYADVLQGRAGAGVFKDRIAFIYNTFNTQDFFRTPFSGASEDHLMPGGEIHMNVVQTLLGRQFITHAPPWSPLLLLTLTALASFLLFTRTTDLRRLLIFPLAAAFILAGLSFAAFRFSSVYIEITQSIFFLVLFTAAVMTAERKELSALMREFLPAREVDSILKSRDHLDKEMRKVVASVLFADIRGYTTMSEKADPAKVMELLRVFHAEMGRVVKEFGGEFFDYQGDAQMIVFGAPRESPDHAKMAVTAALAMQDAMEGLRSRTEFSGLSLPDVGIGIVTGEVAIGYVGSEKRQLAAIGDTTNVAARIQGLSKEFASKILISESTFRKVEGEFAIEKIQEVRVKGRDEPVVIYRVLGRARKE
jgi:adenylate cyclase